MATLGLALSGGGARGAYQAGALKAIGEIAKNIQIENPFQVYTGVSAGAINSAFLTTHHHSFTVAAQQLAELWSEINSDEIFRGDSFTLSKTGLQWMASLSLGGIKNTSGFSLLNTSPFWQFINKHCNFSQIQRNIEAKKFNTVAITAMNYSNTNSITFVQSGNPYSPWIRVRRHSEDAKIEAAHIIASGAIPILFPPIKIDDRYFGDGCIRNQAPCAPAISLGVDRLIAIGVRKKQDLCITPGKNQDSPSPPSIARVANVLLNAVMMDGMENDIERIERTNLYLGKISPLEREGLPFKIIDYLWLSPSEDISVLALKKANNLSTMIKYLLRGLGSIEEANELLSYLLFDPDFCSELIDLGYRDAMKERIRIESIMSRH